MNAPIPFAAVATDNAADDAAVIIRQLDFPVFQNKAYPTQAAALQAVCGDVELVQCPASGLVHNRKFNPDLLCYDSEYQNEQAWSPAFKKHLDEVLGITLRNFGSASFGVEIGCGKGYFFEQLCQAGANVMGCDPAYEGSNSRVLKRKFDRHTLRAAPDYLILRHVLEHIPQPWEFLAALAAQCQPGTKVYIEVPCFDWIVSHHAFYDVFYEHVNYFTRDALAGAFGLVVEAGDFFGGQYLYLVADLSSFRKPERYTGKWYSAVNLESYLTVLFKNRLQGRKTFIWGAGAKGMTFSNILARHAIAVDGVIDINPAKQGQYTGKSGVQIVAPETALPQARGADIFVMNPIYLDEIKTMVEGSGVNLISMA
ncbi:MAG: methyltransferase domain-containing protein [Burkholderiaceae bacterium]|nr:MAG: methyltransferase domain-containing protein [Burkholderiaceae bacterium]